ncbi:GntR family transcriptional regulator [Pseudahrensia aquimaris]|uniref:GntR family transcriptional regulator n=1 Tax=Pseudahrensia aquimaris TaxID=744461 RepID=A0ABW3FH33_9HYPH
MAALEKPARKLEAQPLYARVKGALVERLISGQWKPGAMLPSEFAIAAELGVSQGTVRKSLDEMTAQGLLVRRQGKGTFVAEAADTEILFRFYRLTRDEDEGRTATRFPDSRYLAQFQNTANEEERRIFNLPHSAKVWRIDRTRHDGAQTLLWERITLPCTLFEGLSETTELPNNVYRFYAKNFGHIVSHVNEKLKAVALREDIAPHLGLEKGTPVLEVDRRAIALDGQTIEWRVSLCRSDVQHYRNVLR